MAKIINISLIKRENKMIYKKSKEFGFQAGRSGLDSMELYDLEFISFMSHQNITDNEYEACCGYWADGWIQGNENYNKVYSN